MAKPVFSMSSHDRAETKLLGPRGGRFIAQVIYALTGRTLPLGATVIGMTEYPFRARERPAGHKTSGMRLDALFAVLLPEGRLTVGVEVKTSEEDLVFDDKLHHELVADYLFLAVPRKLIPAALFVIRRQTPECARRMGLVDLDDGDVVVLPARSPRILKIEDVLVTAILRGTRLENFRGAPKAEFVRRDRLKINALYSGMLAVRYMPRLPRPGRCHDRFRHSPLFQELLAEETWAGPA